MKDRSKTTIITSANKDELESINWMRHSAATEYVTSLKGISIRELNKVPPFDQVAEITMSRWSVEDGWVERRQKYFLEVRSEIEARIAEKLIQTRVRQLEKMEDIADQLADEIIIGAVEAKSKEGLVTAMVRLMEAQDGIREKLAKEVVPAHLGGVQQETLPMTPEITTEEARVGVKAILQRRRVHAREKIDQDRKGKESPETKKPKLSLVKGEKDA